MPRKLPANFDARLLALLGDRDLTNDRLAVRLDVSPSTVAGGIARLREAGHAIPCRRKGRIALPRTPELVAARLARKKAKNHLYHLKRRARSAASRPAPPTRAELARRIETWTRWQARRRERGLPAAGKPYAGLARILGRNERRAEA